MSGDSLRLDKWLWHARFYKSRNMAAVVCSSGRIRINGVPVAKSNRQLKPGDVLTFPHGSHIRVIRVLAIGKRRGPAAEARLLYEDLAPIATNEHSQVHPSAHEVAKQEAPPQTPSESLPTL